MQENFFERQGRRCFCNRYWKFLCSQCLPSRRNQISVLNSLNLHLQCKYPLYSDEIIQANLLPEKEEKGNLRPFSF